MFRERARTLQAFSLTLDVLCIGAAFAAATVLRIFHDQIPLMNAIPALPWTAESAARSDYAVLYMVTTFTWIALLDRYKVHLSPGNQSLSSLLVRYSKAVLGVVFCASAVMFALRMPVSRAFFFYFESLAFLLIISTDALLRAYRQARNERIPALLIGELSIKGKQLSEKVIRDLRRQIAWPGNIIGILDINGDQACDEVLGVPVIGHAEDLRRVLNREVVDEVILALPGEAVSQARECLELCAQRGLTVRTLLPYLPFVACRTRTIDVLGEDTVVVSSQPDPPTLLAPLMKRGLDIAVGVVGVIIFLATFPFMALAIKHGSRGPIFFGQTRVGKNGREFQLLKYRTMIVDADAQLDALKDQNEMVGTMFKMKRDPRVTKVGYFLRAAHLDELPQFFQVLMGKMSTVGTRPPTIEEVGQYTDVERSRLALKPGLTGLWQLAGNEAVPSFADVVELDNKYIREWTISTDLRIIARTTGKVLDGLRRVMVEKRYVGDSERTESVPAD